MHYIETSRLILRDWQEEDLPEFARINRDTEVMKYFPRPLTADESRDFYKRICRELGDCGYGLYAVEVKESSRFIGYIGLHRAVFEATFTPCVEIGWCLCREAWGRAYATEGAVACLEKAFGHLQLPEVYSFTSVYNKRSERVMQKVGMHKVGEFEHPQLPPGHPWRQHVLYVINNPF